MRTDFIDYPTAWEIQKTSTLKHDPACSAGQAGFLLCDCEAMPLEWARRASEAEPERLEAIYAFVRDYLPARFRDMPIADLIECSPDQHSRYEARPRRTLMSSDGAHLGVTAKRALDTILGGEPSPGEDEQMGILEWRAYVEQPDQEPLDYGEAARRVARMILEFWMEEPRRAQIPSENVYEEDGAGKLVFNSQGGLNLVTPGLYEVMKTHGRPLEDLGITGFQWGWAVNAARRCVELPPEPNPAIITIGTDA